MDTLYTFGDNIPHYKTKSVHFLGLMNSATKLKGLLNRSLKGSVKGSIRVCRGLGSARFLSSTIWPLLF